MDNKVLSLLNSIPTEDSWPNSWQIASSLSVAHEQVVSAIKSLEAKGYLHLTQLTENKLSVNEEGISYAKEGTPEFRILHLLLSKSSGVCEKTEIETVLQEKFKIGLSNGAKRLFAIEKTSLKALFSPQQAPEDEEEKYEAN